MIWILPIARITGGHVWKLEDDRSELAFPDGVRQLSGVHACLDAAS
jgi:hypothetical protein